MFVKICGVRRAEDAMHAAAAGADVIGMVMVPGSARYLAPADASTVCSALRAYREQNPSGLLNLLHGSHLMKSVAVNGDSRVMLLALAARTQSLLAAAVRAKPLAVRY
jgi:phosphoribosylanthranilate isomerase